MNKARRERESDLEVRRRGLRVDEERANVCAVVVALVTGGRRDEAETRVVVVLLCAAHHQQVPPGGVERQRAQPLRRVGRRLGAVGVEPSSVGQRCRALQSAATVHTYTRTHARPLSRNSTAAVSWFLVERRSLAGELSVPRSTCSFI